MPVIEQGIVARLAGSTAVTSLAGTRIYPNKLPQEPKLPALTYDLISSVRESVMSADSGDVHARVQVTAWANTYAAASNLNEGVRAAVQRWSGTSTGVVIQEIFIENEFSFHDEITGTYAHQSDLIVHYEE